MADQYKMKMAMIAAASKALELKEKNPKASDQNIIQEISDNSSDMILKIDENIH
jgi:hypothetical protein